MAGLPDSIIKRANEILESFEQKNMFTKSGDIRETTMEKLGKKHDKKKKNGFQYPLFTAKESEIEREIQEIDIDNLTPIEALNKISKWRKKI
jgi:DNA mismatch repair protein MutS